MFFFFFNIVVPVYIRQLKVIALTVAVVWPKRPNILTCTQHQFNLHKHITHNGKSYTIRPRPYIESTDNKIRYIRYMVLVMS